MLKEINIKDSIKLEKSVITFGNYDGLHVGHKYIINKLTNIAVSNNVPSILITFNPHTRSIIKPNSINHILTSHSKKISLLKKTQINYVCTIEFDDKFSKYTPKDFIHILIKKFNPMLILLGYDNKFGRERRGDFNYLNNMFKKDNLSIKQCDKYSFGKHVVKSSLIRELIINSRIEKANQLLGYNYSIKGYVIKGSGLGRKIGYPTANIKLDDRQQLIPSNGVYSVNLKHCNILYDAICNIGNKPTVNKTNEIFIEVHIINNYNNDLYNECIEIHFNNKIRNEVQFDNIDELKKQIKLDIELIK